MTNYSKKVTRLRMLSSLPARQDFIQLLNQANDQTGTVVQLPWVNESKQESMTLACTVTRGAGDPEWVLTSGFGIHSTLVWSYKTGDIDLIENMMFMETSPNPASNAPKAPTSFSDLKELVGGAEPKPEVSRQAPERIPPPPFGLEKPKAAPSSSLQGNLTEMQVAGLLQSISINKMSGQLTVKEGESKIEVYFEEGMPVHAVSPQSVGDFAVLDLLTWQVGNFQFIPLERTAEKTINRRLEGILMEGAALVDQNQYLTKKGLKFSTYLLRKNLNLTEADFERALQDAAPLDMNMQKSIYTLVDHKNTFADVLRVRPLVKAEWVPIMYNLISNNLVELSDKPTLAAKQSALQEVGIDQANVRAAYTALLRPETGMMSFQLFLHFLEQEFIRYQYSRSPFSLIVFDVRMRGDKGVEDPLAGSASKIVSDLFEELKRPIDTLGHFRSLEFALILPFTEVSGALVFANRLVEALKETTLPKAHSAEDTRFSFGIAGLPQDCQNLGTLIAAAVEAKRVARENREGVVAFNALYKK